LNPAPAPFPLKVLLLIGSLMLAAGCAALAPAPPPLAPEETSRVLSAFSAEAKRVRKFYGTGKMSIKSKNRSMGGSILVAAERDPLRLKLEMTHSWGRPISHVLIQDNRISMVVFPEKRCYRGPVSAYDGSGLIPPALKREQIWSFLRGFPLLSPYHHARSTRGDRITLFDRAGTAIQILEFDPERMVPEALRFPESDLEISFSDFQTQEGIRYAEAVKVSTPKSNLRFELDRMVFNRAFPEAIFQLDIPPGYEIRRFGSPPGS